MATGDRAARHRGPRAAGCSPHHRGGRVPGPARWTIRRCPTRWPTPTATPLRSPPGTMGTAFGPAVRVTGTLGAPRRCASTRTSSCRRPVATITPFRTRRRRAPALGSCALLIIVGVADRNGWLWGSRTFSIPRTRGDLRVVEVRNENADRARASSSATRAMEVERPPSRREAMRARLTVSGLRRPLLVPVSVACPRPSTTVRPHRPGHCGVDAADPVGRGRSLAGRAAGRLDGDREAGIRFCDRSHTPACRAGGPKGGASRCEARRTMWVSMLVSRSCAPSGSAGPVRHVSSRHR